MAPSGRGPQVHRRDPSRVTQRALDGAGYRNKWTTPGARKRPAPFPLSGGAGLLRALGLRALLEVLRHVLVDRESNEIRIVFKFHLASKGGNVVALRGGDADPYSRRLSAPCHFLPETWSATDSFLNSSLAAKSGEEQLVTCGGRLCAPKALTGSALTVRSLLELGETAVSFLILFRECHWSSSICCR